MIQLLKAFVLASAFIFSTNAANLPETVKKVKGSIVAIAIEDPIANPRYRLIGTGFAVKDGLTIVTNAHVIQTRLESTQRYVVISGSADSIKIHPIKRQQSFESVDLAVLQISDKLPALELSNADIAEGSDLALTGYPITDVLGLFPATHRATLSAITPMVIPQSTSQSLSAEMIKLLRTPIVIYQLDATAYPGNSGSPLYDPLNGKVVGIINMVYVKRNKEAVLSDPSGISYAIPVQYLMTALEQFK
jgi:serine protease Do